MTCPFCKATKTYLRRRSIHCQACTAWIGELDAAGAEVPHECAATKAASR